MVENAQLKTTALRSAYGPWAAVNGASDGIGRAREAGVGDPDLEGSAHAKRSARPRGSAK